MKNIVLTTSKIKELEERQFKKDGSSTDLMFSAGISCSKWIVRHFKKQPVIVICGPGNNGGDGFVIANYLLNKGFKVDVFCPYETFKISKDAKFFLKKFNIKLSKKFNLKEKKLLIDCFFGTGFNRDLTFKVKLIFDKINKSKLKVVSVDLPSGINSDTGSKYNSVIRADHTLALHCKKPAHIISSAKKFMGKIVVIDIGIDKKISNNYKTNFFINHKNKWIRNFPWKTKDSHKYSRGKVIVYAGELKTLGASILSSMAAIRIGTGAVIILCGNKTLATLQIKFPSALKHIVNNINNFAKFFKNNRHKSFLIGPGSGFKNLTKKILEILIKKNNYNVIDADALTILSRNKNLLKSLNKNCILTPHEGEFDRMFPEFKKLNKLEKVYFAAKKCRSYIVLKGNQTFIASPEGEVVLNENTTEELSIIGSGDVLAGIIASLIGEAKMSLMNGACAGVWIHSQLGKFLGKGLIAEDLATGINMFFKFLKKK